VERFFAKDKRAAEWSDWRTKWLEHDGEVVLMLEGVQIRCPLFADEKDSLLAQPTVS
ncbi:hypothetical protein LTR28_011030, partial [Elasticomyces elasticus]